ncbi:MAG: ABC transporter substrate-binding protein, partial [Pseudohongiellaceae bacterium]
MIKKTLLGVATAAALVGAVQAEEVKIGFLGGFTGPIESLTPPIYDAARLAVRHVNGQGGILDGDILVMPSADTTCVDSSAATNGADRLINSENVTAIVGALCSGATIAAANNVGVPASVVMISPASTSPAISELNDNDQVFRTPPSDAYQGEILARLLISKGIEEAAVTYVNNDYGKGLADAFAASFESEGGMVMANEAHEDGKADYRAEIASLAATGSQNLVVLAYAD